MVGGPTDTHLAMMKSMDTYAKLGHAPNCTLEHGAQYTTHNAKNRPTCTCTCACTCTHVRMHMYIST